jgi:hypothetical protein
MNLRSINYKWVFSLRVLNQRGKRFWQHLVPVVSSNYEDAKRLMLQKMEKKEFMVLGINEIKSVTPVTAFSTDGAYVSAFELKNAPLPDIPTTFRLDYKTWDALGKVHTIDELDIDKAIEEARQKVAAIIELQVANIKKDDLVVLNEEEQETWEKLTEKRLHKMRYYWEDKLQKTTTLKSLIEHKPKTNK